MPLLPVTIILLPHHFPRQLPSMSHESQIKTCSKKSLPYMHTHLPSLHAQALIKLPNSGECRPTTPQPPIIIVIGHHTPLLKATETQPN